MRSLIDIIDCLSFEQKMQCIPTLQECYNVITFNTLEKSLAKTRFINLTDLTTAIAIAIERNLSLANENCIALVLDVNGELVSPDLYLVDIM